MPKTVKQRIVSRIYSHGRGWVFTPKDFLNDFNRWEISNSLEDLEHESIIRRYVSSLKDIQDTIMMFIKWAIPIF